MKIYFTYTSYLKKEKKTMFCQFHCSNTIVLSSSNNLINTSKVTEKGLGNYWTNSNVFFQLLLMAPGYLFL